MWYVLQCRAGREGMILRSCRRQLSSEALEDAFVFRCERFWRSEGMWKRVERDMFPGYVFLQSARPDMLSEELNRYREIFHILAELGYMIPVYEDEEASLRELCGARHILSISYGYRDREAGRDCITRGPLKGREKRLLKLDWRRRFAQVEVSLVRRQAVVWAGIGLDKEAVLV
jgi:transcriptional antiterminator NusG